MEIGSEFWLDKNEVYEMDKGIPYWLEKYGNVVLSSSGRGAISLALNQINPKVKKVMLPSYTCESVITPFEKAGYELFYYDLDKHFRPKDIKIENIDVGVFLHMGYFGFNTNEKLIDVISVLKSKSVIIIEDVTHTLFSSYPNTFGNDYIVGSLRKWLGVPSGGFLASCKIEDIKLVAPPTDLINLRRTSLNQKYEYINTNNEFLKNEFLEGFRKAEKELDEDDQFYKIDEISKKIIQNVDINNIKNSRQSNYEFLLKHLHHVKELTIIFSYLEDNVCPIFFPIYVENGRDKLRSKLSKKGIYCPIHWPLPKQLEDDLDTNVKYMYDSILSIPCDQRYNTEDMYRIITSINEIMSKKDEDILN